MDWPCYRRPGTKDDSQASNPKPDGLVDSDQELDSIINRF